jgi:TolC family type I secretion outer membrane protein
MPATTTQYLVLALFIALSSCATADELADPYDTQAMLPLKPSLRLQGAQGDPCTEAIVPSHPMSLFEVVDLALCNNPQTREVWASARVQAAQVGVNKAAYLPNLTLSAGLNRNWPSNGAAYNQRNIGLSLSYLIYDFGLRSANLDSAKQLLIAATYTQDSLVQTIFLAAVQSYYQTQSSLAALDAARESEAAAKASFEAALARYTAGNATPADKYSAQTAYSQATLNRITASGTHQIARGTLANVMGLDVPQPIQLVTAAPVPNPEDFQRNVAALIDSARDLRPDLRAAEAQVQVAKANSNAARAAELPTLSLGASSSYQGVAGNGMNRGSTLGITLSAPIFSGYAPTYRIRSADAQVEVKQAQLEKIRLQVALDVWNAYQNLTTATQAIRATSDLLRSATQSENVASGRYKAGVGVMLDVLNAQSALASARQQEIQARFNWNISRATLAQAMGDLDADLLQELSSTAPIENSTDIKKSK